VAVRYSLKLARKWGKLPTDTSDPTASFRAAPDVERQVFLSNDQIMRLQGALAADPNQNAANAIRLLLLTGARRNEVLQARWENVDLVNRVLRVPLSKSNRVRHVHLNEAAIELVSALPRNNEFLFPLDDTGRPPASLYFPWDRIRKRAGLHGVRLHDLRHTFASVLVNNGVSLFIVQKLLGHAHPKATQRYAHLSEQTLQEAAALFQRSIPAPINGASAS
jgi:integrase